jgi:hypothetical protein
MLIPVGLKPEPGSYELHETKSCSATTAKTLTFKNSDGVPAIGVSVAPNPCNLSLTEWIDTYPGRPPGEPTSLAIDGVTALRFEVDQMGQDFPQVYFAQGSEVFVLQFNTSGLPESGYPAALSAADANRVLGDFRFAS